MIQINPKNNKVLFFSDLHLGVHQNSQTWHNICLDLAKWIDSVMQEHNLDTIFFAGDAFHDRHEIGVNTLHVAKKFFDSLKRYKIHLIPGNHDAYLSSTVEVNSVEILAQENVKVYAEPTTISVNDKKVTFCPWKTIVKDLEPVDMLVGHFEIPNFRMNATKICDHGDTSTNLFEKANAIVTGHFHFRDHRFYNDKFVLYLGSPYEMDFSDRGQEKGVSIIDFDNFDVQFVPNNLTPRHFRLKISDLIQKKYTNLPEIVKSNIVSIYVDTKLDALTLDLLTTKLSQYGPLQFRTEFDVFETAQIDTKDAKKLSIDIETAFQEFVDLVDTRATKKEVLDKCLDLYKLSQMSYE
jgi:DNA repair exonuclease SbcCD nuclease subunit